MNISIIPNIIENELFIPSQNNDSKTIEFIHISTLYPIKNVETIISAFEKVSSESKLNLKLKIIGEKKNEKMEKIILSNSQNNIELIGPLELKEVASQLRESNVLVMLSDYETFSCVIAEAWSCGIPVISTEVGIAKRMSVKNGIIVESVSEKDLITAMKLFLKKQDTFSKEEIRKSTEVYKNEAVALAFDNFYK
jgi:glycosyltransferase involved in cell wall biosynthesis